VFFDYSECTDNYFSETILPAIRNCDYFVLILTTDCLLRCVNEGDWVRREIEEALVCNKKIIPITPDRECGAWPNLPDSLSKLDGLQITTIYTDHMFEDCVDFLIENRFRINDDKMANEKLNHQGTHVHDESITNLENSDVKPKYIPKNTIEKSTLVLKVLTSLCVSMFSISMLLPLIDFLVFGTFKFGFFSVLLLIIAGIVGEAGLICFDYIKGRGLSWLIVAICSLIMVLCFLNSDGYWFSGGKLLMPIASIVPIIAIYLKIWKLQYSAQADSVRLFWQPIIVFFVLLLYVRGFPMFNNVHSTDFLWGDIMLAGGIAEIGLFFYKPHAFKFLPWLSAILLFVLAACYLSVDYSTIPERDKLILIASVIPILTMLVLLLLNIWKSPSNDTNVTT